MKLTINNETVNDSRTIANEFNNFFVSIGPALADTITCSVDPMSYVDNIMNSMVISYVSYMDTKNTILSPLERMIRVWVHVVNRRVFSRSNKYTF